MIHTATLGSFADLPALYWLAPAGALIALIAARVFAAGVRAADEGDEEQIRIASAVRDGAMAYLRQQYLTVAMVFLVLVGVLALLAFQGLQPYLSLVGVPVAGLLSALCGWFGMRMATDASSRTAAAARRSLNDGLTVAFRAGAVMGLNVVGFALLDISVWLFVLTSYGVEWGLIPAGSHGIVELTTIMLSFGMGASLQALFARVGGGIYTKAADVGADLVGKVEAGIPEDDARNPATIADNVGDNVGDVAGMGADLYESYYGSILAAAALGAAAAVGFHMLGDGEQSRLAYTLAVLPAALAGAGILASIVGIFAVRTTEGASFSQLLGSLRKGVYLSSALILLAAFLIPYLLVGVAKAADGTTLVSWWQLGIAIVAGLVSGLVIAQWTEYSTSYEHPPTRRIAEQAQTGPATVIIAGIAEGMKSTWAGLLAVIAAILVAFIAAGGNDSFLLGLYGVGVAAVGMLSTLGITLATDAYGPIADNAGGNAEMSGQPPEVRKRTDMLDSLGNTTAATGKGFAIGSAALTALALLAAYAQVVHDRLETQIEQQTKSQLLASQGLPVRETTPFAVYLGDRRFGLVVPDGVSSEPGKQEDWVAGAVLLDTGTLAEPRELDHLAIGHQFEARTLSGRIEGSRVMDASRLVLKTRFDHGDHEHDMSITVVALPRATLREVLTYYDVTLTNPRVLAGLFLGVMLTFLFCALTMNAVGRAAYRMMQECRRQFAIIRQALRGQGLSEEQIADPEHWPKRLVVSGVEYPAYAKCVQISTAGAQREMIIPSLLAVLVPIAAGLVLGVPGTVGLLAGGLTSGFAVAVFMANAGGAWDNAKKLIESYGRITADTLLDDQEVTSRLPDAIRDNLVARAHELRRQGRGGEYVYGKGSDDHKATVVGDTVGDPFKDTSGPSLNILIKLISIVSVVFAGFVVKFSPIVAGWLGLP